MVSDALDVVRRIGLTGGIGSGKSTVAGILVRLGAVLVDTDAIARRLTLSGGAAIDAIAAAFGADFIDASGALDRARMRELAFSDPGARRRLEAILHPLIGTTAQAEADAAAGRAVVFDVPLLVESRHWRARVDRVLVVDCSEATQAARVIARSGWPRTQVDAVMAQQASRLERRAAADAVVFNDGIDQPQLMHEVEALWRAWFVRKQG